MSKLFLISASLFTFLLGLAVLVGYWMQSAALVQIVPNAVPMAFNTGLTFVFSSVTLAWLTFSRKRIATILPFLSMVFPLLTLYQYLAGKNIGIDTLFANNFIVVETAHPGRMAPQSAVCFLMFSASALSLGRSHESWKRQIFASLCGMVISLVGLLAFLGYLFHVQSLYGWGYFPRMALHTTIGFVALGSGITVCAFRANSTAEVGLDILRYQLLSYSIAGTIFIGIFSSNAGLLPSFSYLEESSRATIATNASNKSAVVVSWAKGLNAVVRQLSSRTAVQQTFEQYQAGRLTVQTLQKNVQADLTDGLSASTDIIGVCRMEGHECILSAGKSFTPDMLSAAESRDSFVTGPYQLGDELAFVAKYVHTGSPSNLPVTDLYLVSGTSLLATLNAGKNKKTTEQIFLAIPHDQTWNILGIDEGSDHLFALHHMEPPFDAVLARSGQYSEGTYQTDVSVKNGALLGYAVVPSLAWVVIDKVNPDVIYAGTVAWMTTAFILVGLIIVVGSIGMFLLLQPLQRQMFIHSNTLEKRIQEKTKEVQRTTEFKSQFLANMSHEIRTPLTAILGFTEQLHDPGIQPSTAYESLLAITRNGKHLLSLINDILDISKIEAGKMEMEHIECSPIDMARETVAILEPRALEKELKLQLNIIYPLPEKIMSDPTRFRQILLNLVSNAVKFTERGYVRVKMEFEAERRELRIEVDDTGIGLTPEQCGRLFTAFNQADSTTTRRFGGTGLGLSITNELIKLLGGQIHVDSKPNVGSGFHVTLPVGEAMYPLVYNEPVRQIVMAAPDVRPMPLLSGTVLLVEDSEDIRAMVSYLIKQTGAKLEVAENGQIAVKKVSEKQFDLVLMDMQMPVMDGYTATRLLRKNGYSLPVVGLTANTINNGLQKCVEAGCNEALGKPFDRDAFHTVLRRYLLDDSGEIEATEEAMDLDEEEMAIRRSFLTRLPTRLKNIEGWLETNDWEKIRDEAHRLVGAALFGFHDISVAAKKLEQSTADNVDESKYQTQLLISLCSKYVVELGEA